MQFGINKEKEIFQRLKVFAQARKASANVRLVIYSKLQQKNLLIIIYMQLNFNFLHCFGLTDVLSANKPSEMFVIVWNTPHFSSGFLILMSSYILYNN